MTALFVVLGIAVLTLLALLLWFVPHLLQQQALRSANEAAQLRDMLLDMLNEQEAVMMRQSQLSGSIAQLQDQLEQMIAQGRNPQIAQAQIDPLAMRQIEERIGGLQGQLQHWLDQRNRLSREVSSQDNEAWANLLTLLAAIQGRLGNLTVERNNAAVSLNARAMLDDLEQEMAHLRGISEDIATLQWRLRRSLNERESKLTRTSSRSELPFPTGGTLN